MTMLCALLLVTKLALTPTLQSGIARTRAQAAPKLAPTAVMKLKTIGASLVNGPALNDYTDATRRAVIAAFPASKLSEREVNALSALVLSDAIDVLKKQVDSISEMGETESLRLQMAMDRMSKMMSTLSNILRKISDTSQSITQNLK